MAKEYHVIHKRSSTSGNAPSAAQLEYGEIAVNFAAGNERLHIKNSSNSIVVFPSSGLVNTLIEEKVSAEATARQNADTSEATARQNADDVLTSAITELETRVRDLESKVALLES